MNSNELIFNMLSPESGIYSNEQIHRIRPMKLIYHLTDDSITLNEPVVPNSGMLQGRLITRQRVPKSDNQKGRDYLHWSDLNVGQDVQLFSKTYRLTSCDQFTKNFLEKNGIKLNKEEEIPISDNANLPANIFLLAYWLDKSNDFTGIRPKRIFKMTIYTFDDTVSLTEITGTNRNKQYYRSEDFYPGAWVNVFSRPMFIFDCVGEETRKFMQNLHGTISYTDCDKILEKGPPPDNTDNIPPTLRFIAKMVKFL
ncbi:unnamed protein product [Dracunculus medinensis]|uniref:DM10 domain-containing protein n=1 Tax=Dracunculus medinensis TaxID=318479 RepID=A0A0N4UDG2_DRAME|nr:unnamed protein product [Dracunculus medinensis]